MKIFCSYPFTGEDAKAITQQMKLVVATLNNKGHTAYCNLFDEKVQKLAELDNYKGLFDQIFADIAKMDAVAAIVTSPNRSVGQIMEIGAVLSQGKPVYLFEHTSATGSTYLPKLATKHYTWDTLESLEKQLALLS